MLTSLLPRKLYASRWRMLWLAFLLLAPVAYAGGLWLSWRTDHNLHIGFQVDRAQALERAARYLAQQGVNVQGWQSFCLVETKNDLHFYYAMRPGAAAERARQVAPPVLLKALFRRADAAEAAQVLLTPAGEPYAFARNLWQAQGVATLPEAETRRLAEAAWRVRPEAQWRTPQSPQLKETTLKGEVERRYTWEAPAPGLPELKFATLIDVRGARVITAETTAKLDEAFAQRHLPEPPPGKIVLQILSVLLLLCLALYGLVRFGKRAQQKEISYQRVAWVSLILSVFFIGFIFLTDIAHYGNALGQENYRAWAVTVSGAVAFALYGLFYGLAYAAGEGDIREANPGKLTALDALITGRIFSRNVARAVVWGAAWAGWLWLATTALRLPWLGRVNAGDEYFPLFILFGHWPAVTSFMIWQPAVMAGLVLGFFLPLPLLQRRLRAPRLVWAALWLFLLLANAEADVPFRPVAFIWVFAALQATMQLACFLAFDLLTIAAMVSVTALTRFGLVLVAQPAPSLRHAGWLVFGVLAGFVLVELYFFFKGRSYRDEEVRPVYAKNLAERLALQAEVSAARVAQERLLPQRLPLTQHLSVAAACVPAREVGGDFYDFFERDAARLGLLVAEGGGQGLGAALTIAYAKGFLMPRLAQDTTGRDDSPTEALRALQSRLVEMQAREGDEGIGLAYAEVDAADGVLRYARTGAYPRVLVLRGARAQTAPAPSETVIKFAGPTPETPIELVEGRAELQPGDYVVLFTGGLVEALRRSGLEPETVFAQLQQSLAESDSTHALQTALHNRLAASAKEIHRQQRNDDLTAVLVRVERTGEM